MRCFIDTNIFLRVLIGDDKIQSKECIKLLEAVKSNKLEAFTSDHVLTEIVWTLRSYYDFPKEKIIEATESIVNLNNLRLVTGSDILHALKLYETHPVKFVDCLIASIQEIREKKAIVVSYDKDFKKLPVLWKTPSQLLTSEMNS